jgi:hypothetical protein
LLHLASPSVPFQQRHELLSGPAMWAWFLSIEQRFDPVIVGVTAILLTLVIGLLILG